MKRFTENTFESYSEGYENTVFLSIWLNDMFGGSEVKCLGHLVKHGIRPLAEKIETIVNYNQTKDIASLRRSE